MTDSVLSKMVRINRRWKKVCRDRLAPYRYVGSMHLIVSYVGKFPGSSQEDVAAFYALDKASVARDATRLEEMGHIQRRVDPDSRRQYRLYLTPQGEEMVGVLHGISVDFENRLLSPLSEAERRSLLALLERVAY